MRVIPDLPFGAAGCAIIPGRGPVTEKGRWVDTGRDLQGVDPHVYLSEGGLVEAMRLLNVEVRDQELAEAKRRVQELETENNRLQTEADAIAGLSRPGFEVRKVKGRKPREKVEA